MALTAAALLAGLAAAAALLWAAGLWMAERENRQLIADRVTQGASLRRIDLRAAVYADLPAPVRRYFDFAFNGRDHVDVDWVSWRETGDFLLPVGRFTAHGRQTSRAIDPVYAWTGRFHRLGLPWIESRDAFFLDGHDMRAKLLGWFTVMHTDYDAAAQRASLYAYLVLRYYGQAPLMPWALLPSRHVRWLAIDEQSAHLEVTRPGLQARYRVRFGRDGRIDSMQTDRLLMEGNGQMQREFGAKLDYHEVHGFRVPRRMDYRWTSADGRVVSHYAFTVDDLRVDHR
jgi:hypothetical protein